MIGVAPASFKKRMQLFDSSLRLVWDETQSIFQIWCNNPDTGAYDFVMSVVNEDGSYRPLDQRTLDHLARMRFWREHPELVEKGVIGDFFDRRERERAKAHESFEALAKDKAAKRMFEKFRDAARSVSWKEWQKPHRLSNGEVYKPDKSMIGAVKPTIPEEALRESITQPQS